MKRNKGNFEKTRRNWQDKKQELWKGKIVFLVLRLIIMEKFYLLNKSKRKERMNNSLIAKVPKLVHAGFRIIKPKRKKRKIQDKLDGIVRGGTYSGDFRKR